VNRCRTAQGGAGQDTAEAHVEAKRGPALEVD
jgi:hypothetical protein